jgi:SNF2 family DNA or RNA helicase
LAATQAISSIRVSAEFEPGDRFEVRGQLLADGSVQISLPPEISELDPTPKIIEDENGARIALVQKKDRYALTLPAAAAGVLAAPDVEAIWLEYRSPGRYCLIAGRRRPDSIGNGPAPAKEAAGGHSNSGDIAPTTLDFDPADIQLLRRPATCNEAMEFELGMRAAQLATHPGFERLISLPMVREMELLEHQTRTATTVLRKLRGRALLCDEVGLGKTVEAGLILSELLMRGLARSVLILTPPSLMTQWQGEMRRKFSIELTSQDDPAFREGGSSAWEIHDRVIVSIHTAKREPHRSAILKRKWDMVIVDEAHHLRNRATEAWKFASEIDKQFILLLTATPVQNNLEELFNLVTLLEPGLLSTRKDFSRRFVSKGDKMTPKNVDELHALLGEVMVRNRRNTVGLQFTRRFARTEAVALSAPERSLYDAAAAVIRERLRPENNSPGLSRMTLIMLQMALGSSAAAAAAMLANLLDKPIGPAAQRESVRELCAQAASQPNGGAKAQRLLGLVEEFPDKLVVFTQFRATQEMLRRTLNGAGHDVAVFHGGLSRMEKESSIEQFRGPARLLLCTESGSEGRNLQFAHGLCNFDLPWNPMKIEQRVGRLSRIGQTRDVHVFNLVAAGTIEAAVLHLLEAKLNMFELVIGEVDMILGNLEDEREFEEVIAQEWAASVDSDEFAARMEVLGTRLLAAKTAYFRQQAQDNKLFGNRFTPEG